MQGVVPRAATDSSFNKSGRATVPQPGTSDVILRESNTFIMYDYFLFV